MAKSRKPHQSRTRPASAVHPALLANYRSASLRPTMHQQAHQVAKYMGHSNVLQARGDLITAWGANLALTITVLEIAARPATCPSEHRFKLTLLREHLVPSLDQAHQGHVARLVEAALALETDRKTVNGEWVSGH